MDLCEHRAPWRLGLNAGACCRECLLLLIRMQHLTVVDDLLHLQSASVSSADDNARALNPTNVTIDSEIELELALLIRRRL